MAKMFQGKETPKEEMAEAKSLKSGKISKAQYVKGEEAEGENKREAKKNADAIKSGKMSPKQYAMAEKKMADGGGVRVQKTAAKKMADGGMATNCVGYRSQQDYGKKK